MRTKPFIFLIIISLFLLENLKSQTAITGEFRFRPEYRNGYQKMPDSTTSFAAFISQRSRLNLGYKNDMIQTYLSVQDVRIWGEDKLKADVPSLGISEAWASLKLSDSASLKIGRQMLIYDNERLLSNNNWQQAAQSHDAAVLKLKYNNWAVDFGGAFNQSQENVFGTDYSANNIQGNYKTLNFLRIVKTFGRLNTSLIGIADGFQKANVKDVIYIRGTYGTNLIYKMSNIDIIARFYTQTGKTEKGKDIEAYYINPELVFNVKAKFKLNPGTEYFSGNNMTNTNNNLYQAFNSLYGTGHNFNGHMDYFTNIPLHTQQAGLIDAYIKNSYKLNEKTNFKIDYHYFMLQNNFPISKTDNNSVDKFLAHELDGSAIFEFSKEVAFQIGYSVLFGSKTLEIIKGGNSAAYSSWAFAMLTVKPSFFKTEPKGK